MNSNERLFQFFELAKRTYPRTSVNDIIFDYKDEPGYYLSFVSVPKLGINPQTSYETPVGIYCYNIKQSWKYYSLNNIDNKNYVLKLPFAANAKQAVLFSVKPEFASTVLDKNLTEERYEIRVNTILKWAADEFDIPEEDIKDEPWFKNLNKYPDKAQALWVLGYNLKSMLKEQDKSKTEISIWNKMYRVAGIFGFDDWGKGYIHPNEKCQAVFFTRKPLNIIGMYNNTHSINNSPYFDAEEKVFLSEFKKYVKLNLSTLLDRFLEKIGFKYASDFDVYRTYRYNGIGGFGEPGLKPGVEGKVDRSFVDFCYNYFMAYVESKGGKNRALLIKLSSRSTAISNVLYILKKDSLSELALSLLKSKYKEVLVKMRNVIFERLNSLSIYNDDDPVGKVSGDIITVREFETYSMVRLISADMPDLASIIYSIKDEDEAILIKSCCRYNSDDLKRIIDYIITDNSFSAYKEVIKKRFSAFGALYNFIDSGNPPHSEILKKSDNLTDLLQGISNDTSWVSVASNTLNLTSLMLKNGQRLIIMGRDLGAELVFDFNGGYLTKDLLVLMLVIASNKFLMQKYKHIHIYKNSMFKTMRNKQTNYVINPLPVLQLLINKILIERNEGEYAYFKLPANFRIKNDISVIALTYKEPKPVNNGKKDDTLNGLYEELF